MRRETTRPPTPEEIELMAKKHVWTCRCGVTSLYVDTSQPRTEVPTQRCLRCGEEGPK